MRQLEWTINTAYFQNKFIFKKSMGGDWQRPRLTLHSYLICVCVHSELSTPEHNIVKSKLCFLCLEKKSLRTWMWHYFVPESSIHVWLMMCFLIFCNQRPNTKHIFQFSEGVVGKLESKNMENTDKNSIFVSKNMRKTAWFCSKNHEKPWKNLNINILTSKLWKMWVCAFGKFKKNKTCHSFSFKL